MDKKFGSNQWVNSGQFVMESVAHTLRGEGFDASEDGTGRGTPLVPVAAHTFDAGQQDVCEYGDQSGTLGTDCGHQMAIAIQERAVSENPDSGPDGKGFRDDGVAYTLEARTVPQAVCFSSKDHGGDAGDISPTLRVGNHSSSHANAGAPPAIATALAVRRVTPLECERLQGFPDHWTRIPIAKFKKQPTSSHFRNFRDHYDQLPDGTWVRYMADGPRYKLCGNSMAVPVMRWVGRRIQAVEDLCLGQAA
jgi:DNA (cytosine-5)-methyltransferase 1